MKIHRLFIALVCAPMIAPAQNVVAPARPRPYPVFESAAFKRAIEKGTRTRTGAPGPNYWQQRADYSLAASLDPATAMINGRGTIRYYNNSPYTLDSVAVQLLQNLYVPGGARSRPLPTTDGIKLSKVSAQGVNLTEYWVKVVDGKRYTPQNGYRIEGTNGWIKLPTPLQPKSTVDLYFEWSFKVPPLGSPRTGQDGEVFHIGYWYPVMTVFDDVSGWNTDQYLSISEFYTEFGDYDVSITAPQGWLVSATGELQNRAEVLTANVIDRLNVARNSGEIVHIITPDERAPGKSTLQSKDGVLTWHYTAKNVRDFVWNASNKYVWDAARAIIPSRSGSTTSDTVDIYALYRPEARSWDRAALYTRHAIEFFSGFLWPYQYPKMTSVEGIIGGGMEFPMMQLTGGNRDTSSLQSVTAHEVGHMWFPMMVQNNERRHAWMDEGLTDFNEVHATMDLFKGTRPDTEEALSYYKIARADGEVDMMRHGDLYPELKSYTVATYFKPASVLMMLRSLLGEETFYKAYHEYARRWLFKHPTPYDLWNTFNDVSGQDLSWFWRTWFYETWTLDQAVGKVETKGKNLRVTIEDRGLAPMPARIAITRKDGSVERKEIPVSVWLSGATSQSIIVPNAGTVQKIEIDPDKWFLDIDRKNNTWTPDK